MMRVLALSLLLVFLATQPALAGALERAMLGKSAVVDLTQPSADGSLATHLHAGIVRGAGKASVARIPAEELLLQAVVVNVMEQAARIERYRLRVQDILAWERRYGRIPQRAMVLMYTAWDRRWPDPARYFETDAQGVPSGPGFSAAALEFLRTQRSVRGVGMDAAGPLSAEEEERRAAIGTWQLDNLTNLGRLPVKGAKLVVAPLRAEAASAPARVIAILP